MRKIWQLICSDTLLLYRPLLWLMFWVNLFGTIYGYLWYENQLRWTWENKSLWLLPFVPDSPTASLFFTIAILLVLIAGPANDRSSYLRGVIGAFGVVTSVKYGIWAVVIIVSGYAQGNDLIWKEYMLIGSHLSMAIEALLFARFFGIRWVHLLPVLAWSLFNDYLDYQHGIVPYLPYELEDDHYWISWFTVGLGIASCLSAWLFRKKTS